MDTLRDMERVELWPMERMENPTLKDLEHQVQMPVFGSRNGPREANTDGTEIKINQPPSERTTTPTLTLTLKEEL